MSYINEALNAVNDAATLVKAGVTENGDSWLGSTVFYAFLKSNQV